MRNALFSLREAYQHILACGRPGAGKTSFLTPIQRQLLSQGAFCLHCCVKPNEAWRAEQLLASTRKVAKRFSPESGYIFNPLTFELGRKGGSARSLAAFHTDLNEVITRSDAERSESFWKSGEVDTLGTAFDLVYLVKGEKATYRDALDVIMTSPLDLAHARSDAFRGGACGQFLRQALQQHPEKARPLAEFLLKRLPSVGDKARGAFVTQAATSIQPFTIPPLCQAVNGVSNLTPERMLEDYTILAFDTLTYGPNGTALQLLVSWFCMEACLRREHWERPFLLVRDEYHQLVHSRRDVQALSVGRSQGLISLAAFQSLPVLEDSLGAGIEAQTQAKALMGLHVNKIWCNNNCHVTNEYAAQSLGMERKLFFSGQTPSNNSEQLAWWDVFGVGQTPNTSFSQQYHFRVEPQRYLDLRTGGPENDFLVDAIVHRGTHDYEIVTLRQR
ncbi:MAG: type IV secretory system conjugative DNA transfer family protein [Pirellulaceae bacterium]